MREHIQKLLGQKRTKAERFLLVLVAIQIVAIFIFNFTRMKYSMDYDAICAVTQAAEMWKQKTLFLSDWSYQTTLGLDSGVPVVALIYGLTKNLFFSYGLVNSLFVLFYVYVYNRVCTDLSMSRVGKYFIFLILFTPYTLGQLEYAKMLFTAAAYYNLKAIMSVMAVSIMIRFYKKGDHQFLFCGIFYLFLFLSSVSTSVYALMCCVFPVILFLFIEVMRKNMFFKEGKLTVSFLRQKPFLFAIGSLIVAAAGLIFCKVFELPINPPKTNLAPVTGIWKNVGSCIAGIYCIFGGLANGDAIASAKGIYTLLCFCIISFILVCLFVRIRIMIKENTDDKAGVLIGCFAVVNFFVLALADMTYSGGVFESRYHLLPMLAIMLCVGDVADKVREHANETVKVLGYLILAGIMICINAGAWSEYYTMDNHADELEQIIEEVRQEDIRLMYVFGEENLIEGRIMKSLSQELEIVVTADGKVGMPNGVSTKYFDSGEVNKHVALLTTEGEKEKIPAYLMKEAKLVKTYEYRNYSLYVLERNSFDFAAGLPKPGHKKAVDYPYTIGYFLGQASINDAGALVADGTQESGYVLWGPNTKVYEGVYSFRIRYKVLGGAEEEKYPFFDVTTDGGLSTCAAVRLEEDKTVCKIKNIEIKEGNHVEFRVYVPEGVSMEFYEIDVQRD